MLPSPAVLDFQEALAETLQRPRTTMTVRERVAEGILTLGFAAVVFTLWRVSPPGGIDFVPAVVCVIVLAVAGRIRIDTPFGFTTPTQLAFVPLVFALPVVLVPIAVVLTEFISLLPDIVTRKVRPGWLIHCVPNGWYSIGPVAVFALTKTSPQVAAPGLLVAALFAQFGVDFIHAWIRTMVTRGMKLAEHVREMWVMVVDAALSGVALLIAKQIHHAPVAAIAPLPLLGLVAMFARERRQRLESLLDLNGAYRRARDEAVEASNMKSAFLRNVSHEIRTPMNGVLGMNELLLQTPLNEEQRAYAEQVEQSGEHMLAIINDILDISQIETGRVELELDDFDLHEAVESACVPSVLEARSKGVEFEIVIDRQTPQRVRGDGARVRQVLMNLAGNAVKFTASGSIKVRVAPVLTAAETIRFEVVDTGIGVDPLALEQMFEPFVQADVSTTRKYGGNGLGLSIARELVELMHGAIDAESEPGSGSRFWFEVPLPKVALSSTAGRRERVAMMSERRPNPDAPLILVVEDSPVNRLVTVHVLERCGFRVHVVNDGREALEALSSQTYAAVLMDCQMPEVDGYEATRELRRREGDGRRTPVIAMTAHAMTGDRERCLEAGMDDYLAKPVRSQMLVDVLERWIGRSVEASSASTDARPQQSEVLGGGRAA